MGIKVKSVQDEVDKELVNKFSSLGLEISFDPIEEEDENEETDEKEENDE